MQSGYAFLHFALTSEGLKSALTAVEEVNNLVVDNIAYQCKMTHTLQVQLLSMNSLEEQSGLGMKVFPPPLSHNGFVSPLPVDSPSNSSGPPSHIWTPSQPFEMHPLPQHHFIHSAPLNNVSSTSGNGYYRKGFHSSGMDQTRMMNPHRTERGFSHLLQSLNHQSNSFVIQMETKNLSQSVEKSSDNGVRNSFTRQQSTGDVVSQDFTVHQNHSSTTSQYLYPLHNDHYYNNNHQAADVPLSSSSASSSLFVSSRNNNNNMMNHLYDNYHRQQNRYDDLSGF